MLSAEYCAANSTMNVDPFCPSYADAEIVLVSDQAASEGELAGRVIGYEEGYTLG